jgi:ligand-binding sensor domain-containing protein/two-component sensor histidine kinase
MLMYKIGFSILFFVCTNFKLTAQQPFGAYMAYGPESKFLSAQNYAVHQSRLGYLWIGNQNGLVRFDGKHYKNYAADHTNPNSPADNSIVDIVEDKNGQIWFCGFTSGLTKYNERTGVFKKYVKPTKDNFQFYGIYDGFKDGDGNLWFATAGRGLAKYLYEKDSFKLFYPQPDKCKDGSVRGENYVTGMCEDKTNHLLLWVSSFNGLYSFNKQTEKFTHYPNNLHPGIFLNSCDADANGNIWAGTWGAGLWCFNSNLKMFVEQKRQSDPAIVYHVKNINDSTLLTACFSKGLFALHTQTGSYADVKLATANTKNENFGINKISVTATAGIFAGGNNCVYQFHPSFDRLNTNIFFEGSDGNTDLSINDFFWNADTRQYWIATSYGNGIYRLNENETTAHKVTVNEKSGDNPAVFKNIIKDAANRYWANSYFTGLYWLNNANNTFEKPPHGVLHLPDSLLNNVKSLHADAAGNIWMLCSNSIVYYNVVDNTFNVLNITWDKDYNGPRKYAPAILRNSPDGNVWLLTQNGMFCCDVKKNTVRHIYKTGNTLGSLASSSIEAGVFTKQNSFWLTAGNTLQVFDWKHDTVLSTHSIKYGLPSAIVKDVAADSAGRIWVNTLAGLALFDPAKKYWRNYNHLDGLQTDYLDGNIFITANNKIVIDQKHGFVLKDLTQVEASDAVPQLRFTAISVNGKEYRDTLAAEFCKSLQLAYNENNIEVEFAAMDWLYPAKTIYLYRLEGLSESSHFMPITETKINLAGIAPGNYRLIVKALSGNGKWSNEIALPLIIAKPFWQTALFITLCILLVAALIYSLFKYRINQLKKMQRMRNAISRDLHDDIGASLSNINILNELAKRNAGNPEKATAYLNKAGEDIQHISEGISDIIWNINPRYDDLQNLFVRMRRYAADMLEGKNINHNITMPESTGSIKMNMDKRRNIFLIFKEAVNNLAKYSKATNCTVAVSIKSNILSLTVSDDGCGFNDKGQHTGNGLANMRQRAVLCGGQLQLDSTAGKGTTVTVTIPLH